MVYCEDVRASIKGSLFTCLNKSTNPETKRKQILCVASLLDMFLASLPWSIC